MDNRFCSLFFRPLRTGASALALCLGALALGSGCSDRFDTATTLGSGVLDDLDPSLTGSEYLYRSAVETLGVVSSGSVLDTSRRFYPRESARAERVLQSGLHYSDTVIAIGTRNGESALGYAEFTNARHDFTDLRHVLGVDLLFERSGLVDSTVRKLAGPTYSVRVDTILSKRDNHKVTKPQAQRLLATLDFPTDPDTSGLVVVELDTSLYSIIESRRVSKTTRRSAKTVRTDSSVVDTTVRDTAVYTQEANARYQTFVAFRRDTLVNPLISTLVQIDRVQPDTTIPDSTPIPSINRIRILESVTSNRNFAEPLIFISVSGDSSLFYTTDTTIKSGVFANVEIGDSSTTVLPTTTTDTTIVKKGTRLEFRQLSGPPTAITRWGTKSTIVTDSLVIRLIDSVRNERVEYIHEFDTTINGTLARMRDSTVRVLTIFDSIYTDTTWRRRLFTESFIADTVANFQRTTVAYSDTFITVLQKEITTSVIIDPLHLCLSPDKGDSALFRLRLPYIRIRHKKTDDSKEESVTRPANRTDYAVSDDNDPIMLDSLTHASWATDRTAFVELDLEPVWNAMTTNSVGQRFTEILTATLPIGISGYQSEIKGLNLRYALVTTPVLSTISPVSLLSQSDFPAEVSDTTVELNVATALNRLYRAGQPSTAWLHVKFDSVNRWVSGTITPPVTSNNEYPFSSLIFASPEK